MNCERERERGENGIFFGTERWYLQFFEYAPICFLKRRTQSRPFSVFRVYHANASDKIPSLHSVGSIAISRNSPIAPPPLPPLRPCSFSRRIAMADGYHQPNEYTRRVIFATTIQRREKYSSRGLWEAISNKNLEDRSSFPREKWLERLAVCQFVYRRYRPDVLLLYICVFA